MPQLCAAGIVFRGDGVEPPEFFARGRVVRADEALLFAIGLAAAQPLDHLALGDERAGARAVVALGAIADRRVPDGLAGARVERHQVRVARGHEELVFVHADAAHRGAVGVAAVPVLPDQLAGLPVDRLQHVARVVEEDDAVVDERRGLVGAALVHRPDPLQAQILHVVGRDLIQRAVIGRVVVAPDHQPVGRIRIAQHRLGDRDKVLNFAVDGDARRRTGSPSAPARRLRGCRRGAASRRRRRRDGRGLTSRHRVDRHIDLRRERGVAGQGAVRLQDERRDVEVLVLAQRAGPRRRHRQLHERQELARRAPAPGVHELGARQLCGVAAALQIGEMTARAVGLVGRPSRGRLRRGEGTAGRLLPGEHHQPNRPDGRNGQTDPESKSAHGLSPSPRPPAPNL